MPHQSSDQMLCFSFLGLIQYVLALLEDQSDLVDDPAAVASITWTTAWLEGKFL